MTPGKVSIVILNWNKWEVTGRCLESLRQLDYPDFEVIVVDNASDSPPPDSLIAIIPGTVLLRNPANFGFGKGNNPGIRLAMDKGAEFIWLLNNDTLVMPDTLRLMINKITSNNKLGATGCELWDMEQRRMLAYGGGKVNLRRFYTTNFSAPTPDSELDYLTAASLLLRVEALEQSGLFDEKFFMYWEDVDLCLRLRLHQWQLAVAAGARVLHEEGISSSSVIRDCYSFRSVVYFASKYAECDICAIGWIVFDRIIKKLMMFKLVWFYKFAMTLRKIPKIG
jgi:GT2 family glycosyltransferase